MNFGLVYIEVSDKEMTIDNAANGVRPAFSTGHNSKAMWRARAAGSARIAAK
jgi:hypothetical protein